MRRLVVFIFVFSFVILTGCGLETKTLTQFYEGDINKVSKIVILDGNTGYKKTIEDKKTIESFLSEIKDIKFIPDENQEARSGFNYAIGLYQNGVDDFSFGLTQINDHYYHTEPDIFLIVDNFYTNLDIKEE
ncbi:hypothetical protein [Bacillus sp. FJAT-49711]|uniref:hypothetical protein n=1 Tax=Bacillus sp. FJAT-49711 TaxID=2833585 RepID=UPI0020166E03|nr:hypothetical protein [Bacillus sp. FJAT-49711]